MRFPTAFVRPIEPASVRRRMLDQWLPFLIYGAFAFLIPASMIVMSFMFAQRPSRRTRARVIPFESGVSTGPPARQRFTVSFYLTAMLFIVFDIEIVFLYPLAVVLDQIGWFALLEFLFFIAILVIAYVYVWRKGALEWH
jgi:NADH-quinone oxidoreductase subunit A